MGISSRSRSECPRAPGSLPQWQALDEGQRGSSTVGLLIGQPHRFRVAGIPGREGLEVFPTVELIDRLYPPPQQKTRFPIPIQLTAEELQMALAGKMVTRVIYLEDPRSALPLVENPGLQRYFEVAPGEDPLEVADRLGRPVAILRMGSRLPSDQGPDDAFFFGSPPLEHCAAELVVSDVDQASCWSPPGLRCPWPPDEYICDGGDGEINATVGADAQVHGLEAEDALLRFDTLDGRAMIEPTNRVCIYAPRFAAVRKVTGVLENERHLRMARIDGQANLIDIGELQVATHVAQPIGPQRQVGSKLANTLDEHAHGVEVADARRLVQERNSACRGKTSGPPSETWPRMCNSRWWPKAASPCWTGRTCRPSS